MARHPSITFSAGLVLAVVMTFPAAAQEEAPDSAMRWFSGIDVDGDGFMTLDEMTGVRDKRFGRTDGNDDGLLTVDEYTFGIPKRLEDVIERRRNRFAAIDRDGDGSVTKEEYMAFGDQVIEAADLDGDGKVSRAEFTESVTPDQDS
jgi:Ca2+-binding EF-hand superfamily protein